MSKKSIESLPDPRGPAASSHIPSMLLLQQPASELKTERMAPSSVLARARDFLPQMAAANDQLTAAATNGSADELLTIEKVVPVAESSSGSSSDDSSDDSASEDGESPVVDGPPKIAMDVMLFANDDENSDGDSDEDEDVPTAWRTESDKANTKRSPSKKSKIEEL
uniref:Uncharacterized protein n=2 Tax=Plectus sambesii TaxID=2011161 RepID=A0A914X388_9BILA